MPLNNLYYFDPPIHQECRNNTLRDFDKDPIIISTNIQNNPYIWFLWSKIAEGNHVHLKNCDINCIYYKDDKKDKYSIDGYLNYYSKNIEEKKCKYQKNILISENEIDLKKNDIKITNNIQNTDIIHLNINYEKLSQLMKIPKKKTKKIMASIYISSCKFKITSKRLKIIQELRDHGITIDIYGHCNSNIKEPKELLHLDRENRKIENIGNYKFYLSFESKIEKGFISDQYWDALIAGTVPIYLGNPDIEYYQPRMNSIIHFNNFNNISHLSNYILYLNENENEYKKLLKWKRIGPSHSFLSLMDQSCVSKFCKICYKLADLYNISFHENEFLIRERNTFRYIKILLYEKTFKELLNTILETFKYYKPLWVYCWTKELRRMKNRKLLKIYEIYKNDNIKIQNDNDVFNLKKGDLLQVIFI